MGLNFSHTEASWSYSGFDKFRHRLAQEVEIDLDMMDGFGGDIPFDSINDQIKPLLDHSDCEGELTPEECATVAPRLRELVSNWDYEDYDKRHALYLAEGMDEAASNNENLRFY